MHHVAELRDVIEVTRHFALFASLGDWPLRRMEPASQPEAAKHQAPTQTQTTQAQSTQMQTTRMRNHAPAQRHVVKLAKGCIERTIQFASVAIANLDTMLRGASSSQAVHHDLRQALNDLQQQLPAASDVLTSEMRDNFLSLVHCAQIDGTMRIREVREVVVAIKVSLETLLENLTIVERSANPSASRFDGSSNLGVDEPGDPDAEMADATGGHG